MAHELTDEDRRITRICLDFAKQPPGSLEQRPHWHDDVLNPIVGTDEEVAAEIERRDVVHAEQRRLAKQDIARRMARRQPGT